MEESADVNDNPTSPIHQLATPIHQLATPTTELIVPTTYPDLQLQRAQLHQFVLRQKGSEPAADTHNTSVSQPLVLKATASCQSRKPPSPISSTTAKTRVASGLDLLRHIEAEESQKCTLKQPLSLTSPQVSVKPITTTPTIVEREKQQSSFGQNFSVEKQIYGKRISATAFASDSFLERCRQIEAGLVVKAPPNISLPAREISHNNTTSGLKHSKSVPSYVDNTSDTLSNGYLNLVKGKKKLFEKMSDPASVDEVIYEDMTSGHSVNVYLEHSSSTPSQSQDACPPESSDQNKAPSPLPRSSEVKSSLNRDLDGVTETDSGQQQLSAQYSGSQLELSYPTVHSSPTHSGPETRTMYSSPTHSGPETRTMYSSPTHSGPETRSSREGTLFPSSNGAARRHGGATADLRSYMVEKEVIESQLRKLQMENSSLVTENKLLKEKYNRSQSRVVNLESQLVSLQREADSMQDEMSDEMSLMKRRSRDRTDRDRQEQQDQIIRLTKQLEVSKVENVSLEKQLESARRAADLSRSSSDRTHRTESLHMEIAAYKEEAAKVSKLLLESERSLREEIEQHKEKSAALVRLTEVNVLLQHQLDTGGGGSVAEKQLKSVERRLQITEERLTQERGDRAGKLCEVEEKLLNDNARLQVSEKDLKRQLNREKDRHRNVENKYREQRAEAEKLRIKMAEQPNHLNNSLKTSSFSMNGLGDMTEIWAHLMEEDGLEHGQEEEAIRLLWQQRRDAYSLLKEWEIHLSALGLDKGDVSSGLQNLRTEVAENEGKLKRALEKLDDAVREREQMEVMLKGQVKDLLNEKHTAVARLRSLEDLHAAMTGEVESLKNTLQTSSSNTSTSRSGDTHTWEVQVESLKSELFGSRMDLQQSSRHCLHVEAENESLRSQLRAKEQALDDAQRELESHPAPGSIHSMEQHHQLKVDNLTGQLKGAQAEISLWREKHSNLERECAELEEQLTALAKKLSRAKIASSENHLDSSVSESDKLAFESELHEKDTQVLRLTIQYNEIENELQRTKQLLLLQHEHNEELSAQLEQVQTQLRQRTRMIEKMSMTECDQQVELQALQENLVQVNTELAHKSNELKVQLLEVERERQRISHLEQSLRARDMLLSQSVVDAVREGRITSVVWGPGGEAERSLSQVETRLRQLETANDLLTHELQKANACLEGVTGESSELMSQCRELRQELVKERAQVCQITSDKMEALQRIHLLTEERDALMKEKTKLEFNLARQETHTLHVLDTLESQAQKVHLDYKEKYRQVDAEGKQMLLDLSTSKRLLEAREKENNILRNTIEQQKVTMEGLSRRLAVTTEEHKATQDSKDQINNKMTTMMKETASLQSTIQQITSEKFQVQQEKLNLEKSLSKEHTDSIRSSNQVEEVQAKLNLATEKHQVAEQALHHKQTQLVAMESKLEHCIYNMKQLEEDKVALKSKLDKLYEEVSCLRQDKSSLEERLAGHKLNLHDEKSSSRHLLDELAQTRNQLEALKHEYDMQHDQLETEKQACVTLRLQQQTQNELVYRLESQLRSEDVDHGQSEMELASKLEVSLQEKASLMTSADNLEKKLCNRDHTIKQLEERLRDHTEVIASEKVTLIEEKHKLTAELHQIREENLSLKVELQKQTRSLEAQSIASSAQASETRLKELERLENLITQLQTKITDTSVMESTRSDIQKMMNDIMHCLHEHTQAQKSWDLRLIRHSDGDSSRSRLVTLESALSQEQAMHLVTRTQLSSMEEDNRRLRQQLQSARKRLAYSNDADKSKSRMEEINEIIARSQTRAAQLLASGIYGDDPLLTLSPSRDFLSSLPNPSYIARGLTPPPCNLTPSHSGGPYSTDDLMRSGPISTSPDRVFLTEHT